MKDGQAVIAPPSLRELAAAVIRRAMLDLEREGECEECKRPLKVCAREFLSGKDGSLTQWTNLTGVVREREITERMAA